MPADGMASGRHSAIFRFYAELNDFLPRERRFIPFNYAFEFHSSIKDTIEALGVPHPEVDLILCNSVPVDFRQSIQDGDRISAYPAFASLDVSPLLQLRPPRRDFRFILDIHLGRLATYLRLLGFDAEYETHRDDSELARISHRDSRILLTRDCGLLKRSEVIYGYFVRGTAPIRQAIEVLKRYRLFHDIVPFQRCLRCNSVLHAVSKESIEDRLQPQTRQSFDEFRTCPTCSRIYWSGSHYDHMLALVQRILAGEHVEQAAADDL
jgi:uncharacterized protein with PIN domain